jgi:hypothetical protein
MLSSLVFRLSYANVIGTLALFVALGGSSYAALNLPKGSVDPKQLEKNSVSSPKVKRGSLLVSDFKASQRESLRGPQGPQGVAGPSGAVKVVARFSNFQFIPADTSNLASVDCFPGEVATGGGIEVINGALRDMVAITSRPTVGPEDVPKRLGCTGVQHRFQRRQPGNDRRARICHLCLPLRPEATCS